MEEEATGRTLSRRQAMGLAGGALAGAALLGSTARRAEAAPLPTGNWSLNANGSLGTLVIASVDATGNVSGSAFGNPIEGFYDSDANELFFLRILSTTNPSANQIYTGYLFQNAALFTLAGYFEAFAGSGGTTQRHRFGWFARRRV